MRSAAMCDEEKAFQDALDRNGQDHTTRLVFADWLQERGDERAAGYRALAVAAAIPNNVLAGWPHWWSNGDPKIQEWAADFGPNKLPKDWYRLTAGDRMGSHGAHLDFPSRREAEDAAALAFARLPPERQAELLATPVTLDSQ